MWRPRCFSALASWSAASSSRWRSALLDPVRRRGRRAGPRGRGGWPRPARHGAGPRRARCGEVVVLEALGEPHRPVRRDPGGGRGVGVPVRGRGGTGGRGDLGPVGVGQQPGLELHQLGLRGLNLGEGGGCLGGVHRPDRHLGGTTELIADTSQRPGDRVWLVGDRCHGSIPALATDTRPDPEPLVDKGFRHLGCARIVARPGPGSEPGPVPVQAAVVSTSSTSGGRLPARAAGVSRRSLRDLLNHRRASGGLLPARAARVSRRSRRDLLNHRRALPHPTAGPIPTTGKGEPDQPDDGLPAYRARATVRGDIG